MCSQEYLDVDIWARRCEEVRAYPGRRRKSRLEIQQETERTEYGGDTNNRFKKKALLLFLGRASMGKICMQMCNPTMGGGRQTKLNHRKFMQ